MANARESEKREGKGKTIIKEEYKTINETMMTQTDLDAGEKTDDEERDGWFKE